MLGEFAKRLRYYRKLAGFKQAKDFANVLGIGYTTYISYENRDREPKYELLCQIANKLHVTTDELLGNKPKNWQWKPKREESYYVPDVLENEIGLYVWDNDEIDNKYYDNHLVCRTPEEAKEKLAKMLDVLKDDA